MEAIWLSHYPPGIPAEVDVHEFASLKHLLSRSCQRFGPLPAYSNMGISLTYAELDRLSRDFASYLQTSLSLRKGDRVAIMMPNLLQYAVALFGVLRAGLVVVNINPQFTASELEHQLEDSRAAAIVVLENFAHTVQAVLEKNPTLNLAVITTQVGDLFPPVKRVLTNVVVKYVKHMVPAWRISGATKFSTALRTGHRQELEDMQLGHDDTAFLQYTGGTTGVAKSAVLTHGNLVANVQQMWAWMARDLVDGKEIFVCPLPMYHVYALTSCLVFMRGGAHSVLVTNPRDMPAFIHDLKKYPFTIIIAVNTLYRALLDAPEFAEVNTHALKVTSAGGMAVQRVVAERWKQRTGVNIIEGYGLTETSPVVIANPLDSEEWTGTIGLPIPSTQATILGENDNELAIGDVGEICVRGPQVMPRYWNRPDETEKVFTRDGWLRTGDMGLIDERGYFRITDRKKDVIVVSGFKVFPNQSKTSLRSIRAVAEVGAIGVRDDKAGEVVKIVVVKKDPPLTKQALLEHCRKYLTGYKVPKIVEFRGEPLPKSNLSGKILRRRLREAPSLPEAVADGAVFIGLIWSIHSDGQTGIRH